MASSLDRNSSQNEMVAGQSLKTALDGNFKSLFQIFQIFFFILFFKLYFNDQKKKRKTNKNFFQTKYSFSKIQTSHNKHHNTQTNKSVGLNSISKLLDEFEQSKDKRILKQVGDSMKSFGNQVKDLSQNPLCKTKENNPLLISLTNKMKDLVRRTKVIQSGGAEVIILFLQSIDTFLSQFINTFTH